MCKWNGRVSETAWAVFFKVRDKRTADTRESLLKWKVFMCTQWFCRKKKKDKYFKASGRVEILLTFPYLFSLFPEHMFHNSFISKWRRRYCPKYVVWLALLGGRFCVTHVYFMPFQTICFLALCLTKIMRNSDCRGVQCYYSSNIFWHFGFRFLFFWES